MGSIRVRGEIQTVGVVCRWRFTCVVCSWRFNKLSYQNEVKGHY